MVRLVVLFFVMLGSVPAHAQSADINRGAQIFQSECARCHIPVEMERRMSGWVGRSAEELFRQIRLTMPAEAPGSLTDAQFLDVTLYVMQSANVALPDVAVADSADLSDFLISVLPTDEITGESVPWTDFNGNLAATRYAPFDQINADNVDQLEILWRWSGANFHETVSVASPLMANGQVFNTAGATRNVVAMDAETGLMHWMWRPQEGERFVNAPRKGSGKGLAYWRDDATGREVIFTVTPGYYLVALNADTGLPVERFGAGGWVDLQQGLRIRGGDPDALDIGLSFPPLVVDDVVIVGAAMSPGGRPPSASNVVGDVRGFDVHTGELLWTFKTIPEEGEYGYDTWLAGADYVGNTGAWAPMSADPELGLAFIPVEAPTGDYYGGDHPGNNLFSSSTVAVDYRTGEVVWYFQHTHHDIWDWDTPAAPVLADMPDGRKLVVQVTKQGWAFVFDRATGEPVWEIVETPVPQTDVPGEWTSPTQPIPTRPAPFDRQGLQEHDLIDFTEELRQKAIEAASPYRMGPMYTPPSLVDAPDGTRGTLSLPFSTGGANWEGAAFDPDTGMIYISSQTMPDVLNLVPGGEVSTMRYIRGGEFAPRVDGLPLVKPPYGRITAIDLHDGEHVWQIANADTPDYIKNHPALEGVDIPRTGIPSRAGLLLTKTLLFAGEGRGGSPVFRAHDKMSGEIIAEIDLPATQTGQPMTYIHNGKQYILLTVSDSEHTAELIALGLPD